MELERYQPTIPNLPIPDKTRQNHVLPPSLEAGSPPQLRSSYANVLNNNNKTAVLETFRKGDGPAIIVDNGNK